MQNVCTNVKTAIKFVSFDKTQLFIQNWEKELQRIVSYWYQDIHIYFEHLFGSVWLPEKTSESAKPGAYTVQVLRYALKQELFFH